MALSENEVEPSTSDLMISTPRYVTAGRIDTIFWPRPKYALFTSCNTLAQTAASISMTLANEALSAFGSCARRDSSV